MIYLAALGAATLTMIGALAIDSALTKLAAVREARRKADPASPCGVGSPFMDSIEFNWPRR